MGWEGICVSECLNSILNLGATSEELQVANEVLRSQCLLHKERFQWTLQDISRLQDASHSDVCMCWVCSESQHREHRRNAKEKMNQQSSLRAVRISSSRAPDLYTHHLSGTVTQIAHLHLKPKSPQSSQHQILPPTSLSISLASQYWHLWHVQSLWFEIISISFASLSEQSKPY